MPYSPLLPQITANALCKANSDPCYFGRPMHNAPQRFGRLAAQFELMARNLNECHNPKQRRELLIGMMVVLDQIDGLLMSESSLLGSKPDSTAPPNPPKSKSAHG
jgi:hypothetical protein